MTRTKQATLPAFEEQSVNNATVRITNAGDGLSEALKVDPKALHLGEQVYYVLSGDVTQINHVEKDEILTRVHTVKASAITEVDADLAGKLLTAAAEELSRRKAEVDGQLMLEEEAAATEREDLDAHGTPAEIAQAAHDRAGE